MNVATIHGFQDELRGIEKDAGIGNALRAGTRALRAVPAKANQLAVKGLVKAHNIPGGKHLVNYVTDPLNTSDLAISLGKYLG